MISLLKFVIILVEQSVQNFFLPTVFSMDSQPRRAHYFACEVQWATLCSTAVCFASHFPQSFSLRYALKNTLEKTIFNLYPTSFSASFILFYSPFFSYESTKDKLSLYLYWKVSISLRGCFAKVFYPLTIIGKFRAVCRGISRKFYKKIAENFSRQQHIKRKFDYIKLPSTLFIFNCFLFFVVINSVDSAG